METVSVDVDYAPTHHGDHAGLALFSDERHFYTFGISQTAAGRAIVVRLRNGVTDPAEGRTVASIPLAKRVHRATLRLDIRDPECAFSYRLPGRPWANVLEHADTSMLASEASNQFTGAVVGPFAARASAYK
jgi:alpha-N-arabinofuranosidase